MNYLLLLINFNTHIMRNTINIGSFYKFPHFLQRNYFCLELLLTKIIVLYIYYIS